MNKPLQHLVSKLSENNNTEGFKIYKNIRGGNLSDPPDGGNGHCNNQATCSGTNTGCYNASCVNATNVGAEGCTNFICMS